MKPRSPADPPSSARILVDEEEVVDHPASSLDEVERALSLLDGRHQDAVKKQRVAHLAMEAKRAAAEADAERAIAAQRRGLILRIGAAIVALGALASGGLYGYLYYARLRTADAALAPLAAPYLATGWRAQARPWWRPRSEQTAVFGADTCILALATASPGSGKLVVERAGGDLSAVSSAAWCTCRDERVVVRAEGDGGGGVELLSQQARSVGGGLALAFLSPRPVSLPATSPCAIDPLDAWLADGHGVSPKTDAEIAVTTRDALKARGFTLVASAPESVPFAVVPGAADSCFVAASTTPGEELALRVALGLRPLHIAPGTSLAIGWCTHLPLAATVFRSGKGSVAVYRADATGLPGTAGLREAAARAGLGDVPTWVSPGELGWDASAPLVMSGVSLADITVPKDGRPVTNARLVSLALENARVTPDPDEIDRYSCFPALDVHPRGALCVQSTALAWHAQAGTAAGIAESPLPFWMDVMTNVEDAHGLTHELELITLSRRLAREGYEATAREGVLEEQEGVTITGRSGDDRVVAIGLTSLPPWVLPYTDDAPWSLDGEPHSIALAEGEQVHLTMRPWSRTPADIRRTVVFRHRVRR